MGLDLVVRAHGLGSAPGGVPWANNRDEARFNFDFNFDTDDISVLDAYD